MAKMRVPSYSKGDIVCIKLHLSDEHHRSIRKYEWHFGKIGSVLEIGRPEKQRLFHVDVYSNADFVPDVSQQWEYLYPGIVLDSGIVLLNRLEAGLLPTQQNKGFVCSVEVPSTDICKTDPSIFRRRLMEVR
jgi:hypothetical protein